MPRWLAVLTPASLGLIGLVALAACKGTSDPPSPQAIASSTPRTGRLIRRKMPSGSMLPTLAVGERFAAEELAGPPRRGDVIVFKYPERPEQEFVKRVIATEGDKLEMKDGHPVINGWVVPSCVLGVFSYVDEDGPDQTPHEGDLYVEFLEDAAYLTFYERAVASMSANGPWLAKKGESWVLGDNRYNSHDSRMWFGGGGGGVPRENLLGRLEPRAPELPPGAPKELQPKLDACLKTRPEAKPPRG